MGCCASNAADAPHSSPFDDHNHSTARNETAGGIVPSPTHGPTSPHRHPFRAVAPTPLTLSEGELASQPQPTAPAVAARNDACLIQIFAPQDTPARAMTRLERLAGSALRTETRLNDVDASPHQPTLRTARPTHRTSAPSVSTAAPYRARSPSGLVQSRSDLSAVPSARPRRGSESAAALATESISLWLHSVDVSAADDDAGDHIEAQPAAPATLPQ
eukprot:CAMPEP_0174831076 /NCGR_PEP_ID=MMETSP1114-20130205/2898_1 /TAXON_ID=312471 /ORGANISM="Neobodo designis, Strain CCAP 1951/1" /LENGTH=216 /DNA_ID=CAMNT_0016064897 /DNA_START=62 /DNA_END=712 /DNA_ORIENTATION=+